MHGTEAAPRETINSDIRTWESTVSTTLYELQTVKASDKPFRGSVRSRQIGDVTFALLESDPHRLLRSPRNDGSEKDKFGISLQLEGQSIVHQLGQNYVLDPGDFCIYDPQMPSVWMCKQRIRVFLMIIPQSLVAPRERQLHAGVTFVQKPAGAIDSLSSGLLHGLAGHLDDLDEKSGYRVARALFQLLSASLASDEPRPATEAEHTRATILQYVTDNLADPTLSPATVAAHFYMSSRSLFRLFAGEERTLAKLIHDERMLFAHDALQDPDLASVSIAHIAEMCGFDDANYFSRVFRTRFGRSPSEFRRQPEIGGDDPKLLTAPPSHAQG